MPVGRCPAHGLGSVYVTSHPLHVHCPALVSFKANLPGQGRGCSQLRSGGRAFPAGFGPHDLLPSGAGMGAGGNLGWVEGNEPELRLVFGVSLICSREDIGMYWIKVQERDLSILF